MWCKRANIEASSTCSLPKHAGYVACIAPRMRRLLLLAAAAATGLAYYAYRKPAPSAQIVEDDVLIARVRKALDGLLEQPGSVNIAVQDGCVTLTGPAA